MVLRSIICALRGRCAARFRNPHVTGRTNCVNRARNAALEMATPFSERPCPAMTRRFSADLPVDRPPLDPINASRSGPFGREGFRISK
jgi:hypothetical protein